MSILTKLNPPYGGLFCGGGDLPAGRQGFAYKSSLVGHSVGSQAAPRGAACLRHIAAVFEFPTHAKQLVCSLLTDNKTGTHKERCFVIGGGGEIRTPGGFYPTLAFQASALDRYATPP